LQLGQLQNIEPQLTQLGYQILAVSPSRPQKLRENHNQYNYKYLLLSDSKMTGAKSLGIAFKVDKEKWDLYKTFGFDLENITGESHHLLPVPAVFIIGKDGVIKFSYVNPNFRVRLDPDVLLAAAKAALK